MSQFTLFCYPHLHLWAIVFFLALNGGGRIFFSPRPLPYFPLLALLSCHVSSIERLSLHCSSNWKNYGFDQLVSQRNWHHLLDEKLRFWGTRLPLTERLQLATRWTRGKGWRIVCLAALSVEDIEDIYLFGTMITGLLLIGLGFALGYRRIQENGKQLSKASQGCPSWLKQWEERSALRLRLLTAIWISIMEKAHCFAKENRYRRPEWTKRE